MNINKKQLKEIFSYHSIKDKNQEEKYKLVNESCVDLAIKISKIIDNPAELTIILRKIQELRMLCNQAITFDTYKLSYRNVVNKQSE